MFIIILFHMFKELSRDMKDILKIKLYCIFQQANQKHKKNKENDTNSYHNQLPKTSKKEKILKAIRENKRCTEEQDKDASNFFIRKV